MRYGIFLTFFNNILILTCYGFYLHDIARLVAPALVAQQVGSVAPLWLARQGCHAGGAGQRRATQTGDVYACRARRGGAIAATSWARAGPLLPHPPFLLPPDRARRLVPAAAGDRPRPGPPKSVILGGGEWGKTFRPLPRRYCLYSPFDFPCALLDFSGFC